MRSVRDALPNRSDMIVAKDRPGFNPPTLDLIETLNSKALNIKGGLKAGAAHNIGADLAYGQWLIFLDDNDSIAL